MNNKKLVITMVAAISILLLSVLIICSLKVSGIDLLKISSKNNTEIKLAEIDLEKNDRTIEEKIVEQKIENTEEINFDETVVSADFREYIESSRSTNIDRTLYVNVDEKSNQEDYEEVKTYIPLSEVRISFDMDVSKPCGLSEEDFVNLVNNMRYDRTGILKANAETIWECCQKYSVNEIFVLGICGIESAWCSAPQHQRTHNYASLMSKGKLIPYATDKDGFEAMIKLLGQNYLTPGRGVYHGKTITGVGTSYCNTTTWPPKVYKCMQQVFQ